MKLEKNNNTILNYQLAHAMIDSNVEFEVVFNSKTLDQNMTLTYDKFNSLAKRIRSLKDREGHKYVQITTLASEELDISFQNSNLRITLHNKEDIVDFCKNKVLKSNIDHTILYKERYDWEENISNKIGNKTDFTDNNYVSNYF